jgi:long-chain acyl-CoA synthetase
LTAASPPRVPDTVHGVVLDAARRTPDEVSQAVPGTGEEVRYGELAQRVRAVAHGLAALGLSKGDRVGLVAENSPRWLHADLGVLAAGGVDVPRGCAAPPAEVAAVLSHAGCRMAFVEDVAALERFRAPLDGVERVVVLHGGPTGDGRVLSLERLLELGARAAGPLPEVAPDDVATLVYTSGTTGDPKGVTLLHRNVTSNVRALEDVLPVRVGEVFLSVLPTWHMYERTVGYFALSRGARVAYTDLRRLRHDLATVRPHYLPSVPRIWERVHDAVVGALAQEPPVRRALAKGLLAASLARTRARRALARLTADAVDRPLGVLEVARAAVVVAATWPLDALAARVLHRRVREATGGRLVAAVSGGAALPPHVDLFFAAAGVTLLVGYGLTETSPVVAVRRFRRNVLGTIGTPLASTELRVVDPESGEPLPTGATGVLQVRGPQVMEGYWRNPEATAGVLRPDGWFDTGDLCRLTTRSDVVFCGRAKDTIVLLGGENVEPEPLEQAALASPVLEQVVLVGQDRKTLGALVWPNRDAVLQALGGVEPEPGAVLGLVRTELDRRLGPAGGFRAWERVQHVALLPEALSYENGLLTGTLKVRRRAVAERHAKLVDALFGG